MSEGKFCSPKCRFFRCGKRALTFRGDKAWCRWTDEECDVANCNYAICVRRRLLPGGICGEKIRRKTTDITPEEALGPTIKLRGRALRRMGEREIF